jgi:uncharacterized protein YciI
LESEIKRLERKMDYYKNHPIKSEHGVVSGSMSSFPYAQCHFVISGPNVKSDSERRKVINQLLIDIAGNKQLYEDMKLDMDITIEEIDDVEMRLILQRKYIDRWTDEKIAKDLGCSRRDIGYKIDKFLKK